MELKDGWAPLAKFLDKPIPDEPFPRVNEAAALDATIKKIFVKAGLTWLCALSVFGLTGYAAWTAWAGRI